MGLDRDNNLGDMIRIGWEKNKLGVMQLLLGYVLYKKEAEE